MSQPPENISAQDIQRLAYYYQVLQEQQRMLYEQLNMLQTQLSGVSLTVSTLEGLKEAKPGHELVIPLGTNAFTKATIEDPDKILVFIKKDILIEKSLEESIDNIKNIQKSNQNIQERLGEQLQEINGKIAQIEPQMRALSQAGAGQRRA